MAVNNRWLVLIAMTGSLSMIMLDQTVVTVALPVMSRDLPLSPAGEPWVVNAYVLTMAALVAFGGKLGNRLGPVTCSGSASSSSSSPPSAARSARTGPSASRGCSPPGRCRAPAPRS